jgi:hypothetical protein
MAYSYTTYTGNGSTTQFAVPFGYIRREHVAVTVAGSAATFTWVNGSLIQMDAAPANGAAVVVYRTTPLSAPLVNFSDGSTLVAADLDTNATQSIYTQQELDDSVVDGLANVIPNGDKGDITTSVGGTVWTIDNGVVTSAKIADGAIVNADVNASAAIAATKLAFTPSGSIAATTVEAAIQELDTEKAPLASPSFTGSLGSAGTVRVGSTTAATSVDVSLPAASATIGNVRVAPSTAGQARYHLFNGGATAEWLFGQKTSTDHAFKLSKSVAGSETDYIQVGTDGSVVLAGPVTIPAGSSGTPAINFAGDTNTGFYLAGTDQLGIATGGTGRVFVNADGSVGIGSPNTGTDRLFVEGGNVRFFAGGSGTALEIGTGATGNQFAIIDLVGDTTYSDYALRLIRDNGGANSTASIRHRGTGIFSIVAEDAGKVALGTSNTGRLFVTDNGIGIGTNAPGYQLALATDSAGKPSTNTWTIASDERLKENIELANLDLCYLAVKTIPLKRYKWKDEIYSETQVPDRHKLGWIAQDVQAVFPKAVNVHDFKYNQVFEDDQLISEDVIQDCLDLNADQLYAAMYGAMQKLIAKVETLEAEIELLKV